MRLCERCQLEAVKFGLAPSAEHAYLFPSVGIVASPEQECEWWAHKELNGRVETNIFQAASKLRREMTPDAYMELIGRLLGEETKTYIHGSPVSNAMKKALDAEKP